MKHRILIFLVLLIPFSAFTEVTFNGIDLCESNQLLFKATADSPGFGTYKTLFQADMVKGTLSQLTFFPEKVMYLRQSGQFQIQNRFGIFRTDGNLKKMHPIDKFNSFVQGKEIQTGKINPVGASPDGKYLLYLVPESCGYADLKLYKIAEQTEYLITGNTELTLNGPGALWAPDSQFFIYSKGEEIYYYSIDHLKNKKVLAEEFRSLGKGKIRNIRWSNKNDLFYIAGSLVYKVLTAEFFTSSLYSDLLNTGQIVGKIPFEFDPNFDSFWISPDCRKILLNKGGRNIFIYFLKDSDYISTGETMSLPYLYLPRNTRIKSVLWSKSDIVTILAGSIIEGETKASVFRYDFNRKETSMIFDKTSDTDVKDIVLSEDSKRAAVINTDSVVIKDYTTWEKEYSFSHPDALHSLWIDEDKLIISGKYISEMIDISSGKTAFISLSQTGQYGFSKDEQKVQVQIKDRVYQHNTDLNWETIDTFSVSNPGISSEQLRVYLEPIVSGSYRNMVMVRKKAGYGTDPLFKYPHLMYEPFPKEESPAQFTNFTHGSRIRRREVSLVFNAIDSVEGLTEILNTLSEYKLRCTFFLNGEFIRRNPEAVKEISESGHEVGSLFYAYFNMTDAQFEMDKNFIKRGLARNEDDYFAITKKEISLLWHAPYYFINSDIIKASSEMNYSYIGRDVDPLDWAYKYNEESAAGVYLSSSDIIERIIKLKKPGSIIPIRVGETEYKREDYLFNQLDLLINAFISLGYDIVPVSVLMEHAK